MAACFREWGFSPHRVCPGNYYHLHKSARWKKKKKKAARVYGFSRESDGRGDGRVEVGCLDLSLSSSEKAGSFCEERRRSVRSKKAGCASVGGEAPESRFNVSMGGVFRLWSSRGRKQLPYVGREIGLFMQTQAPSPVHA